MKKVLFLTVVLFMGVVSLSYSQHYFPKSQLIADIDTMYISIREIHPDMFTVISQEEFEEELQAIKTNLEDSLTQLDFFERIVPLVVKIGDGHTGFRLPANHFDKEKTRLFPFTVKINKKEYSLVVRNSLSDDWMIPEGSTILSINGRGTKDILFDLMKYRSGEKDHFRLSTIENDFSNFMWICYRETSFSVEYKDQKNRSHTIVVPGVTIRQFSDQLKKNRPKEKKANYSYMIDKEKRIAVIDFRQFDNPNKFKQFIDSAFKEIKENEIQDLIIDIRNNGGGNSSIGDEFFQYISPVPYRQFGPTTIKISSRLKEFYKQYYKQLEENGQLNAELKERFEQQLKTPNGIHTTGHKLKLNELRENPNRFNGNIYLLTSNSTFSSASKFSWAFSYFKMGTIIGEETGGMAVAFGDVIFQTLPHTKLEYGVSHKKFYSYGTTDENIHGTLPDYEMDAEEAMEFAIKLIKEKRGK